MKQVKRILIGLISLALIVLLLLAVFLYVQNLSPVNSRPTKFEVPAGTSLSTVSSDLEEQNIIRSALFFKLWARFKQEQNMIKAGSYEFPAGLSSIQIFAELKSGVKEKLVRFTIPEGWTISKIARHVEEEGFGTANEFIFASTNSKLLAEFNIPATSVEGYLFPDTYFIPLRFTGRDIMRSMLRTFFTNLEEIYPAYKDLSREELHSKIILASIVQMEYRVDSEAKNMASVFYNRLASGMRLESCATIVYILTEELLRPHPKRIFFADLELESPYNTYLNSGLTPNPIASPGRVAIEAVFFPASTDFLFFVVANSSKGSHKFTRSLADHNKARELYLSNFLS